MDLLSQFYPEAKFGGFSDIDVTIAFYNHVNALIKPESVVVDFGCGRGLASEDPVPLRRKLRILHGKAQKVIGLDVDPVGAKNACIDEFRLMQPGREWPVNTASVDLVVSDCVMEHLPEPTWFFRESRRVLRQGGSVCIRTPNTRSYIGLMSRLLPGKYHASVLSRVQETRKQEDVFPTVYRCNTLARM